MCTKIPLQLFKCTMLFKMIIMLLFFCMSIGHAELMSSTPVQTCVSGRYMFAESTPEVGGQAHEPLLTQKLRSLFDVYKTRLCSFTVLYPKLPQRAITVAQSFLAIPQFFLQRL